MSQPEIHESQQNLFCHPLKSKVEQRMKIVLRRLSAKDKLCQFGAARKNTDELIEFISIVANGSFAKVVSHKATDLPANIPKRRGRPIKKKALSASFKIKSKKQDDGAFYASY
jgi:hypothetical protein